MTVSRLRRFAQKPWSYQRKTLLRKTWRLNPNIVIPIRLAFGPWWLAQHEYSTSLILEAGYEPAETAFVRRVLEEGMTVFDIGANRGYYSLLASQLVGARGRVIAFEPSARERWFLKGNLLLNRRSNVAVEPIALGSEPKQAELFVANGYATGCNCLRSREDELQGHREPVAVHTLDEYSIAHSIQDVDLLKIDIEGGELDVFQGASNFLRQRPRPIILCEIIDQLARRWGYEPRESVNYLTDLGFQWFDILANGRLCPMPGERTAYNGDYVAIPDEKLQTAAANGLI